MVPGGVGMMVLRSRARGYECNINGARNESGLANWSIVWKAMFTSADMVAGSSEGLAKWLTSGRLQLDG